MTNQSIIMSHFHCLHFSTYHWNRHFITNTMNYNACWGISIFQFSLDSKSSSRVPHFYPAQFAHVDCSIDPWRSLEFANVDLSSPLKWQVLFMRLIDCFLHNTWNQWMNSSLSIFIIIPNRMRMIFYGINSKGNIVKGNRNLK